MGNSFGKIFRLSTFGESHGPAIGGMVDGCPAGLSLSADMIQKALDRRKPGQSALTTQRKESDRVQILSGLFEGKTTGAPIGFILANEDAKSKDYSHLKDSYRPSHADYTWEQKYGFRDYRGGGRSSARETAVRVAGGAIAAAFLATLNVQFSTYVERVKSLRLPGDLTGRMHPIEAIESNPVRCPDPLIAASMDAEIREAQKRGDTVGGSIRCVVSGLPAGWGEPVFDKLHADLAKAMVSINAVKGFEIGSGIEGTHRYGSEENDSFIPHEGGIATASNNSGGIQGGISNGQLLSFSVAFKPVSTIMQTQQTVNKDGETIQLEGKGRHDPCVLPRAVPIVEAMAALVLADHALRARNNRL